MGGSHIIGNIANLGAIAYLDSASFGNIICLNFSPVTIIDNGGNISGATRCLL